MNGEKIISAYAIPGVRVENYSHMNEITNSVFEWTCNDYKISRKELFTKGRYRRLCEPRQVIMYILAVHHIGSLKDIGGLFKRDHTTVIHARDKISGFMGIYPAMKERVKHIELKSGL